MERRFFLHELGGGNWEGNDHNRSAAEMAEHSFFKLVEANANGRLLVRALAPPRRIIRGHSL